MTKATASPGRSPQADVVISDARCTVGEFTNTWIVGLLIVGVGSVALWLPALRGARMPASSARAACS